MSSTLHLAEKIQHTLSQSVEPALAKTLLALLQEQLFVGQLSATCVEHICQKHQITRQQLALALLPVAACYASPSVSHFNVGAVAQGKSGAFYFGANQEFAGSFIQQSVHAEQSAIAYAWVNNEPAITDITVNYTPCGHCRQFMNELNSAEQLKIHLPHSQDNLLQHYLPDSFGPADLAIQARLFDSQQHQLTLSSTDPLVIAALNAANHSHSPYSQSFCGVAIISTDQQIFTGSYLENAAFNPSLPALQVALNAVQLSAYSFNTLQRVVMVEKQGALSQKALAIALLDSLKQTEVQLEYYTV